MRSFKRRLLAIALTSLPLFLACQAENWPSFRGLNQGHAANDVQVPLTWSDSESIKWKVPVDGKAWSSPIVVDGVIYLTTAIETPNPKPKAPPARPVPEKSDPKEEDSDAPKGGKAAKGKGKAKPKRPTKPDSKLSLRAMALKLDTGQEIWNEELFQLETGRIHKKNSHASPTPLFEKGRIYVHFGHHGTACLNASDGSTIWKRNSLTYKPVHGSGSSPILVGDKLVYSADGATDPKLIALNKSDGTVAWQTPRNIEVRKSFSFCTPLLIEVNGKQQIISPCSGAVVSYHPETGEEIWRCRWGEGYSVTPRPVFAHGLIFASSGFDRANVYAIKPDGKGDVTETHLVWKHSKMVPRESSFIIVGDEFYMNDDKGILTCLDAKTGEQHYVERISPEGNYSASPVYASGHLFFTNENAITTVVKPGKTFNKVAENRIDEYGLSSFAIIKDGFLHRTEKHLFRIGK